MVARGTSLARTSRVIAITTTSLRRYNDCLNNAIVSNWQKKAGNAGFHLELRQMLQLTGCPSAP